MVREEFEAPHRDAPGTIMFLIFGHVVPRAVVNNVSHVWHRSIVTHTVSPTLTAKIIVCVLIILFNHLTFTCKIQFPIDVFLWLRVISLILPPGAWWELDIWAENEF